MGEVTTSRVVQISTTQQPIPATGVFIPTIEDLVAFTWNGDAPAFSHSISPRILVNMHHGLADLARDHMTISTNGVSIGGFQDFNHDGTVDTLNAGYASASSPDPALDFVDTEWHHYAFIALGDGSGGTLYYIRDGEVQDSEAYDEGDGLGDHTFWAEPDDPCTYVRRSLVHINTEDGEVAIQLEVTLNDMQIGDFIYYVDASALSVGDFTDIYAQRVPTTFTNPDDEIARMVIRGVPTPPTVMAPSSTWNDAQLFWSHDDDAPHLYLPETLSYGFSFWARVVRNGTTHVTDEKTYTLPADSDGRTFWFLADLDFHLDGKRESLVRNEFESVDLGNQDGSVQELIATYTDDDGEHTVRVAAYCEQTSYRNTQYGGDLRFRMVGAGCFTPSGNAESVTISFDLQFEGSANGVTWDGGVTFLPAVEEVEE